MNGVILLFTLSLLILLVPIVDLLFISIIGRTMRNEKYDSEIKDVVSSINSEINDSIIEFIVENSYDENLEMSEFLKSSLLKKLETDDNISLNNKFFIKNNIDNIIKFIQNNLDLILLNQL